MGHNQGSKVCQVVLLSLSTFMNGSEKQEFTKTFRFLISYEPKRKFIKAHETYISL